MGHPQPKTPAVTDNSTAEGLINKTMTPDRAKTYDFRTNWVKCREAQHHFDIIRKKERPIEQITTLKTTLLVRTKKKRRILICTKILIVFIAYLLARVC